MAFVWHSKDAAATESISPAYHEVQASDPVRNHPYTETQEKQIAKPIGKLEMQLIADVLRDLLDAGEHTVHVHQPE